jgi:hypothetical protein
MGLLTSIVGWQVGPEQHELHVVARASPTMKAVKRIFFIEIIIEG